MAEDQQIIDAFHNLAGRDPRPDEIAYLTGTSQYHVGEYLRSLTEYNASNEYGEK